MNPKLSVCMDNTRSVYNVGSVFRLCDAAQVDSLLLTGISAHPPHPKINKTALGSQNNVSWEYHQYTFDILTRLKSSGVTLLALEAIPSANSIYSYKFSKDTCLVFGNEVSGIPQQILRFCHHTLTIPIFGSKSSLNLATAVAITVFEFKRQNLP